MHSPQILVIEYDHDTRVAYRRALEQYGYVVTSTANGKNGFEILQKDAETIRLVILSLRMPIMDGNDFLRLKLADTQLEAIPVVVIAQSPSDLRYPVTEILQKPISNGNLLKIVKKYLQPNPIVNTKSREGGSE